MRTRQHRYDPDRRLSPGLDRRQRRRQRPPLVFESLDPALQRIRLVEFERRHRQIVLRLQVGQFQIDFDFIDHLLRIETSDGNEASLTLAPGSVAEFYRETIAALQSLGIAVNIWTTPVEVEDRTPFEQDRHHVAYDPEYAGRVWRVLLQADRVFKDFRSRFIGKVSPVHFFWGAFDLAVTRFSGRRAPEHPGAPNVARFVQLEAYSHEVSSCGFWPGGGIVDMPVFYAYAYPEPAGFRDYPIQPSEAFYSKEMREFFLPYDAVRTAQSPDRMLLAFLQSSYEATANLAKWDRAGLERAQAA